MARNRTHRSRLRAKAQAEAKPSKVEKVKKAVAKVSKKKSK